MLEEILKDPFLFWTPPEKWVVKLDVDIWDKSELGKLAVEFRKKLKIKHPYFYLIKALTDKPIIKGSKLYGYRWYLFSANHPLKVEAIFPKKIPDSYLPPKQSIFLYSNGPIQHCSTPDKKYEEITPEQFIKIISSL